jgi:hypothetical protein
MYHCRSAVKLFQSTEGTLLAAEAMAALYYQKIIGRFLFSSTPTRRNRPLPFL